ncbi:MAG: ABC transporter permease [Chloroflexi bacterium]|nr:ABC transporter permease [Chloroflexota bacterium]
MRPQESMRALIWRRFRKHKPALAGLIVIATFVVLCIVVPFLTNYDPGKTHLDVMREAPTAEHIFGTDELGRDMFIRLWDGGRISILIGVATMLIAITIGTLIGSIAGFYGGNIDNVLMRFTDFMLSIPQLFLLLIFAQLLRSTNNPAISGGPMPIIIIIGILVWPPVARLVRGQFLSLKAKEFVEAAKMSGARNFRIILRHILPNAASPIIVAATLRVGAAIITESTLSFLGFGVQPPTATWGNMLKNAQAQMTYAPWTAIFPGLAILFTVLSLNYIGDGLRDALDPHHVE